MPTSLNFVLALVGSLSLAIAVFILIDNPLRRIWSRHWLLQRLDTSPTLRGSHEAPSLNQNSGQSRSDETIIDEEMANFLDAMGREMHLGRSLTSALLHTYLSYPLLAEYIRPIALTCERGTSITEVLRVGGATTATAAIPSCVVFGIRAMWAATTGNAGAHALERAATTLRERTAIHHERRAQSAQARLSVKILTWLPIAFLGWQIITNPLSRWFLLGSPIGWTLLACGLGLNWFGRRWINRVVTGTT